MAHYIHMVLQNNGRKLTEGIQKATKLNELTGYPRGVGETIVPTVEGSPWVNKFSNVAVSGATTTTGTTTLYTTPANKDFFITSAYLSNQSDATADSTQVRFGVTPFGMAAVNLLLMQKLTTTAYSNAITATFNPPLKLARGSAISIIHTFTVGASGTAGGFTGYLDEESEV